MTSLQIRAAIAIKDFGSISKAAAALGLSQPNVSNSIKTLEKEVGFVIFKRSKGGINVTEKGRYFLEHASRMLKEQELIMDIKNQEYVYRLRLGTPYYLDAVKPFIKLCEIHRDDRKTDFRYADVSLKEGIEALDEYKLDVIFAPALKSQLVGIKNGCEQHNLTLIPICELPAVINLRKDHPAVLDGRAAKITQGCDLMKDYPYAVDRVLNEDSGSTGYNDSDFILSSYKIYADELDVRRRIVAKTNAFYFGLQPSKGLNERYGTVSVPVPGIMMDISCIIRNGEEDKPEILEYISLLKEELQVE